MHVDFNYNLGYYAHVKARAMKVPLLVIAVEGTCAWSGCSNVACRSASR